MTKHNLFICTPLRRLLRPLSSQHSGVFLLSQMPYSSATSTPASIATEPVSTNVSWNRRDLLLFALSIGAHADATDLHYVYEQHPRFAAFPTYPVVLPFKHTDTEVIDFYTRSAASNSELTPLLPPGVPKFDSRRVVDGGRKIVVLSPLPISSAGREFCLRTKVLGVYDKGRVGSIVETQQTLVETCSRERKEKVYAIMTGSSIYLGQGNWNGPKVSKVPSFSSASYPPPSTRPPDITHRFQINSTSSHLYRLNGDYNPLHATPEPGLAMGFTPGGTILHGLLTWNIACFALLKALGAADPANLREFQARFAAPVRPGDCLVTQIWRVGKQPDPIAADGHVENGFEEVRFITRVDGGKVCLSNGMALMGVVLDETKSKL